ncbi:MAG: ATP-binding protein [Nitrososphaera sp.]|nr:ATP-binding protein [Nitrososphaera sp.]
MTNLAAHQSTQLTKLLLIGESGTGKTGSLTSLVKAGYKLRILDFDAGLDVLRLFVQRECPDKIENVEFCSLRDVKKAQAGGVTIPGGAKAFLRGFQMLDRWKYEDIDLGSPAEWGPDCILVIDSLSFMSDAAEDWAKTIVPTGKGGQDGRAIVGEAQRAIESMLGLLTNPNFKTNVIVTAHIAYTDFPDGSKRGVPVAPGVKLGPVIARYFNTTVLVTSTAGGRRSMKTVSTGLIELKNPAPFAIPAELPIETALADVFKEVRK